MALENYLSIAGFGNCVKLARSSTGLRHRSVVLQTLRLQGTDRFYRRQPPQIFARAVTTLQRHLPHR